MIDPGHGGFDPGAIGPAGIREKDITLDIAKQVASILSHVVDVRLTKDSATPSVMSLATFYLPGRS